MHSKSETKTQYVPRVNQIDAINLNKDITRLIRDNLLENLQAISPILFVRIQPEIDLIVQSAVWFGSIGKQCSTFGQQLLVLAYDSERLTSTRLILHFCLTVLPSYIKSLDQRRLNRYEWLNKTIEYSENVSLVLSIINFFRFLKTGRKPTLVDFLLRLDYISLRHNQRRDIGYKYLTRELLWGGFMEILGLVLPIINFRKVQRLSKSYIGLKKSIEPSNKQRKIATWKPELQSNTKCVYCGERPTLPHFMGCDHIYCYYCLSGNVMSDAKFCCVVCDSPIWGEGIQPL